MGRDTVSKKKHPLAVRVPQKNIGLPGPEWGESKTEPGKYTKKRQKKKMTKGSKSRSGESPVLDHRGKT